MFEMKEVGVVLLIQSKDKVFIKAVLFIKKKEIYIFQIRMQKMMRSQYINSN